MLVALYLRGEGWGANVRCTPGFWPSKYRQNFAALRPPEPKYHECSGASAGCASAQAAIDLAYEKMVLTMKYLDGVPPPPTATAPRPVDTSVIAGLDLGGLDL